MGRMTMNKKVIVIADDDPNMRKLVEMSIKNDDYEIYSFKNGREVIEFSSRRKIDLAILDALMPGKHGFEVAKLLKENPLQEGIKVFILTSIYTQKKYELDATIECGVDEYLYKPFDPKVLRKKVAEYLLG